MEIKGRQIEPFIKKPDSACIAFLIYGPDNGLMTIRSKTIGLGVVEDLQDPFNVIDLTVKNIIENSCVVSDELNSISMMGGRRLIRIRDATDKITETLKDVLVNSSNVDNIIIIEAGDLKKQSKLRKLFEKQKNAAAIPCYADDARDLGRIIAEVFSNARITITSEALQDLSAKLVGDRVMAVQMAEKVITYIGLDKTEITLDDVLACTEDSSVLFMSDLAKSVMSGQIDKSNLFLQRLFQEGVPPVAICRGLYNYIARISLVKTYIEDGDNITMAMKKTYPPIFFKDKDEFIFHVNIWNITSLNIIMEQIMEIEAVCKMTDTPDKLLCDRLIFRITHMAGRFAQKRRVA